MGAASEQVSTAEKYSAMEQGIIEGWMMPIDNAVDWSYYEVTDYVINVGFFQSSNIHLKGFIAIRSWNNNKRTYKWLSANIGL